MTGEAFKTLREKNGIKRADFARFARLNYQTIYQWERCPKRHPPDYGVQLLRSYIAKKNAS